MAESFYTDGMTVEEIMNLSSQVINNMSARDLSRAIRTMSLAANKRIRRLMEKSVEYDTYTGQKLPEKFHEKAGSPGVDFNALYGLSKPKFGVGNVPKPASKSQEDMDLYKDALRAEFIRTRNFLRAQSSKISGAVKLRQKKEKMLFGMTREEQYEYLRSQGKLANESFADFAAKRPELMSAVYNAFEKFKEVYALEGSYTTKKGYDMLMELASLFDQGLSEDEAIELLSNNYDEQYKKRQRYRSSQRRKLQKMLEDEGEA